MKERQKRGENRLLGLFQGRLLSPTARSKRQLVPVLKTFVFEIKTGKVGEIWGRKGGEKSLLDR